MRFVAVSATASDGGVGTASRAVRTASRRCSVVRFRRREVVVICAGAVCKQQSRADANVGCGYRKHNVRLARDYL